MQVPIERHSSFWHFIDDTLLDMKWTSRSIQSIEASCSTRCHVHRIITFETRNQGSELATPWLRLAVNSRSLMPEGFAWWVRWLNRWFSSFFYFSNILNYLNWQFLNVGKCGTYHVLRLTATKVQSTWTHVCGNAGVFLLVRVAPHWLWHQLLNINARLTMLFPRSLKTPWKTRICFVLSFFETVPCQVKFVISA